jgi:diguanylate cyclase (GGDEF)-like protein
VALAGVAIAWSIEAIATSGVPRINPFDVGLGIFVVAIAGRLMVHLRVGSSRHSQSLTDAAIMLGLMVLPTAWMVLCVAVGITIAKKLAHVAPERIAFNAAKDVLATAAAGGAALLVGLQTPFTPTGGELGSLCVVGAAIIAADELVAIPVIALASGHRVREVFANGWFVRLGTSVIRLASAIVSGYLLHFDTRMAFAMPLFVLGLHLWHANRLQQRVDRVAWQRLARIADALGGADDEAVRAAAVRGAAELFSCDQVDLEVRNVGVEPVLMRGDAHAISYSGPMAAAPDATGMVISATLEAPDGRVEPGLGEIRLRFRDQVTFTERENYILRALAAALGTSLRKSNAVTTAARIADDQARAANQDALTGLANRRHLLEYGATVASAGLLGLAVLDLDDFKHINESLGQDLGDQVLIQVAQRLATAVGPDDMVARLGGDEFALLLTGISAPSVAIARVRQLIASVATPIEVDGVSLLVTASVGVAVAAADAGVDELLRRADVAKQNAKADRQPISIYVRGRDTADVGKLALGAELSRAVSQREFTVAFQPIVDLGSGIVLSAEALARWRHPEHGQLPPHYFLDAIERSGLLAAFTADVLDQALAGARRWQEAGFPMPVAVNVSPRSLLDPAFPSSILAALAAHDMPPETLTIELTETLTLSQLEVVDDVLHALRDLGITLALDDFGTGFSSLATIARVPVHELKIDRSFVAGMAGSTESAIVRSTIELGRSLDLLVVAEGIEGEEQRRRLWQLGCTAGQGHLFARPLPVDDLIARMVNGYGNMPGCLAAPLHPGGAVIRFPNRRPRPQVKTGTDDQAIEPADRGGDAPDGQAGETR